MTEFGVVTLKLSEFVIKDIMEFDIKKILVIKTVDCDKFVENLINKLPNLIGGNVCANVDNMNNYSFIEPLNRYKGYSPMFYRRLFVRNCYLIFDNIELVSQQYTSLQSNLQKYNPFFINFCSVADYDDTVDYHYIFVFEYDVSVYNKYFTDVFEHPEYLIFVINELQKTNSILVYDTVDKKVMYMTS